MQQGCAPPEGVGKAPNPFVNSFLNLCRVCPMPTDDKVNSEYKRNFTWHDGYQATKVDVVRNAPSVPSSEPSLSRKKHYPVQQHSSHLLYDEGGESSDSLEVGQSSLEPDSRARSEERNHAKSRASPRSRSADSTISRRLKVTSIPDEELKAPARAVDDVDARKPEEKQPLMSQSYPPSGGGVQESESVSGVPKTTEYRSQFVAWPRPPGESCGTTARKSASMGLIAAANKKQDSADGEAPCGEQWNATPDEDDDDAALDAVKRGRIKKTEYKAKFRPFSAYTYVDGSWKKATRLIKDRALDDLDIYSSFSYPLLDGELTDGEPSSEAERHAWYSEVVERLKKADQYRVRSHAGSSEHGTPEGLAAGRAVLSPVSLVASSARTWKDDRPAKERGRPGPVPVHHRKKDTDAVDHPKSREGSTKKKSQVEKTTVRPKSAEPVIPVAKSEHKSPKRTRPRAPRDLPVHGHGDLSGRKKAYKQQSAEKSSPVGGKPRAVPRPRDEGGKVWLKPDSKEGKGEEAPKEEEEALVNGFGSEEHSEEHSVQPGMTGDDDQQPQINGEHVVPVTKPPMKVPLTTVKSPEEVTGVRSPDPESWTVPLEIGKGLHWMDGKTPDGVQAKGPPILLSKRLKESSLVGKSQKDIVVCDPGSENTGESVDL